MASESNILRTFRALARKIYARHTSMWFHLPLDNVLETRHSHWKFSADFDAHDQVLALLRSNNVPGTNDPVEIARMQERGQLFVGIREGRQLVGYVKIGWDKVYVLDYGINIQLPPSWIFVLDTFVLPEWRGRGVGTFLISATSVAMRERGFTRRIAHVRIDNAVMLRLAHAVGYQELGQVEFTSFLGRQSFQPHPTALLAGAVDRLSLPL
jgi:GNAT superfamily N-acetyltransferase